LSPILFNVYKHHFAKEALDEFGDLKIGEQVTSTAKYAEDRMLLAEEQKVLQAIADRLTKVEDPTE
jgi:hypothetical protein